MEQRKSAQMPFHIMFHPSSGFETLRYHKLGSIKVSLSVFLAFALLNVLRLQLMQSQFQIVDPSQINLPISLLSSFAVVFIWTLSNWCFCVLIDGKATFRDIWTISVYSLLPYTLAEYLNIFLRLGLTQEENVFCTIITCVGVLWSFSLIIIAFINFHEFEYSKAILSIILTFIGMIIIAVLIFLVYSLFQQLFSNIMIFFNEIIFRVKLAG